MNSRALVLPGMMVGMRMVLALLVTTTACGGPDPDPDLDDAAGNDEGQAVSIAVSLGSYGGVTGLRQGCRLDSSGTIEAFRGYAAGADSVLWRRSLSHDELLRLHAAVEAPGAHDWHSDERGNMTSWASLTTPETQQRWTWSGKALPTAAPAALAHWLRIFRNLCRRSS